MKSFLLMVVGVALLLGAEGDKYRKFIEANSKPVEIQKVDGLVYLGEVDTPKSDLPHPEDDLQIAPVLIDEKTANMLYPAGVEAKGGIKFIGKASSATKGH